VNTAQSVVTIPLDQIEVGQRLRPIDNDYVAMLAASMAEEGQHTPIHVGPADDAGRHALITGAHRVSAARLAGLPSLLAIVFRGDALHAQLLEIDENLMRRGLSELDRSVFLARRKEIYLSMHPLTGRGKGRSGQKDNLSFFPKALPFTKATAEKLGITDRSVARAIARAQIEQDLREMLAPTRWADNAATLDALLKMDAALRRSVVIALTRAEKPARTLASALAERGTPRTNAAAEAERQHQALMSAWRKAGKPARRRFLAFLAADGEIPAAPQDAA
jgi:ParB family chromosome partitioning protein